MTRGSYARTPEHNVHISEAMKRYHSNVTRTHTQATKDLMSQQRRGKSTEPWTPRGEDSHLYVDGRSEDRGNNAYVRLRKAVLERDNHACQNCGKKDGKLDVHHIKPYKEGGEHSMENLQTLCNACHLSLEPRRKS